MDFYSSLGYGSKGAAEEVPTKESVLAQEETDPNSTIDAKRLVTTAASLLKRKTDKPGKFLDIGCGYGFFSVEAINRGFEVTALDTATNKQKVTREITGLNPAASSFESFDCAPASFSVVLMSQILEHVSDVNLWISKAYNILVGGGVLAIALPNFGNAFRYVLREKSPYIIPPEHLNFFNSKNLSILLEKHGFTVESREWVSRVPKRILKARIPRVASPLLPIIDVMTKSVLNMFDALHLGLMVNVYARKVSQLPLEQPATFERE